MKNRNYLIYLEDILEAMNKIGSYIEGVDYDTFLQNDMMVDAVLKNIIIIGEAGKNIPDRVRVKYKDIPWKRIVGLRDIVVHKYFGVDLENVWKIITENIPDTKPQIETLISELKVEEE